MKTRGFTLIELLVVIAIIGLLATIAVVSLNTARSKSKNTKIVADIKQVQNALELFYSDNMSYPSSVTFGGTTNIATNSVTYMQPAPKSPAATEYVYVGKGTWPNVASYTIKYVFDGSYVTPSGLSTTSATATPGVLGI